MELCPMITQGRGQLGSVEVLPREEPYTDFETLYHLHATYVYNACLGIIGNCDDARDATQETFVQLYRSLQSLRRPEVARSWLYRVAINKCTDILRRRREVELSPEVIDSAASGSDRLKEQRVRQAVLRLKPEFRAVVVLFYFEQLSYAEIAEALGVTLDQVRIRLHRARRAFREVYEGSDRDEV
jgi:RNA polymerase sigma-70 factor (ECF subfamily)